MLLAVPVEVTWTTKEGKRTSVQAVTEEVNAHGASLQMKTVPPPRAVVQLTHGKTAKTVEAQVVFLHPAQRGGLSRVTVELSVPSYDFWGVYLPPEGGAVKR